MKRSEIQVGAELYHAHGQDWRCPKYASEPTGERAVVVDVPETGVKVVVDLHTRYGGVVQCRVSPVLLRGEWVEMYAEVRAAIAERKEVQDEARRRLELARAQAVSTANRAARLGYNVSPDDIAIRVDVAEFERLLDRLDGGS